MRTHTTVSASEVFAYVEAWIDMTGWTEQCVAFEEPRCATVTVRFADAKPRTFKVVSPDCFATLRAAAIYEMAPLEVG